MCYNNWLLELIWLPCVTVTKARLPTVTLILLLNHAHSLYRVAQKKMQQLWWLISWTSSMKHNCFFSFIWLQGGPERMQQLWLLISWTSSMKHNCFFIYLVTGWPRKNATTLIVNFMNIVDETKLFLNLFGRTFIFQQNDTMIISFG